MTDLFVANFPYDTQQSELQTIFSRYGEVESVKIIVDHETGFSRGFAFIKMDDNGAAVAVAELNMANFGGRPLRVRLARPLQRRTGMSGDSYNWREQRDQSYGERSSYAAPERAYNYRY